MLIPFRTADGLPVDHVQIRRNPKLDVAVRSPIHRGGTAQWLGWTFLYTHEGHYSGTVEVIAPLEYRTDWLIDTARWSCRVARTWPNVPRLEHNALLYR